MQVKCDSCNKYFIPNLKEKATEDGGVNQAFNCPHCNHYYPVCTITPRGLELRKKIQKATRPERINQLRKKMKKEVKRPGR